MTQPSDDRLVSASASPPSAVSVSSGGKEGEGGMILSPEQSTTAAQEQAPAAETEKVEPIATLPRQQVIELPPDLKTFSTPQPPPAAVTPVPLPSVTLPISDQQVMVGLQAKISNSLAWLALWCQRKLKKAHIVLRVIQGNVVRVQEERKR